ncbi:ExeM/NucH family extracellular endonuclease [Micrococcus sp. IITD107]|uniref:ExeM/NucH family extracellular endonuclease n=1 Tax=Micrococcus sp. IITD107 TaxID=3342790 RepID=UPI0035B93E6A
MSKQPSKAVLAGVLSAGLLASPLAALPATATTTDTGSGATPEVLPAAPGTETISILSFNDFHGALSDEYSGTQFADTVEDYRTAFAAVHGEDRVLLTSAGDLIGASASVSNVQEDEPTIEIMNALGLAVSAAGNHEFDKGLDDLRDRVLPLADFEIVAANFVDPTTREPVLPSHDLFEVGGVTVAVIGAVPNNLYATTTGAGLEGNEVIDLVEGVNTVAAELESSGAADIIVASYHDGASGNGALADEMASSEVFQSIVQDTDPAVDVIFNGHTHQTYNYETTVGGTERPVVQAGQSGTKLAAVELQIDTATQEVVAYSSELIDRSTQAPAEAAAESPVTAEVYALEQAAVAEFEELQSTVIGEIDASITTDYQTRIAENGAWRAGGTRRAETTLGNWAATAIKDRVSLTNPEVDLGVTNAGGLRAELLYDKFTASGQFSDKPADLHGKVTLGEILDFAPFGNTLVYFDIPGSSIKQVLEENWQDDRRTFTLGWSEDLTWTYDDTRAQGDHVTGIWIDGEPVQMDEMYTVGTLSFLADTAYLESGSSAPDGYAGFAQGRENFVDLGIADNQAFQEYVEAQTAAEGSIKPDFSTLGVEVKDHTEELAAGAPLTLSLGSLEMDSDGAGDAVRVDVSFESETGTVTELGTVQVPAEGETADLTSLTAPQTEGAGELVMTVTYDDQYATTTVVRAPLTVGAATEEPGLPSIAEIQGTGDTTPFEGQTVTTEGVVTAVYSTGGFRGYYIQTEGSGGADDATPGASDGIFVYSPRTVENAELGQLVQVTGEATEYYGLTQISVRDELTVLDREPEPVQPTELTFPLTEQEREAHEGMQIAPAGDWTITDNYTLNQYGTLGLTPGTEPLKNPTTVAAPGAPAQAVAEENAQKLIVLDDGASINFMRSPGNRNTLPYLDLNDPVRVGSAVEFTTPVILDYRYDAWSFQPLVHVTDQTPAQLQPAQFENTRIGEETPDAVGGNVSVATFNVLNYFTTLGDQYPDCRAYTDREGNPITTNYCEPRGAYDAENLKRQQDKLVSAINGLDASVVGLEEIENSAKFGHDRDRALATLVEALNADAGTTKWAYIPSPKNQPSIESQDVIRNAFIYQPRTVRPLGESVLLDDPVNFDNAREPLAQRFMAVGGNASTQFIAITNHFKSKGSSGATGENRDSGDGQGAYNADRVGQAQALVAFAERLKKDTGTEKVILMGDFNSYEQEDPIKVLEAAGYVSQGAKTGDYTYTYDAAVGSLDGVFANQAADQKVTGVDIWNINADEQIAFEYSRYNYTAEDLYRPDQWRSSDHDPVKVGLQLDLTPGHGGPNPGKGKGRGNR